MPLRLLRYLPFLFALSATAAIADPITVDTASGALTLPEQPKRIVALDVAAIDTLTALGAKPSGVVAPLFVSYLGEATSGVPVVGSMFEPDFEAIAALGPDLIVVGGRSVAMSSALSAIAPVADMTIGTDTIADGLSRLDAYGALTGTKDKAGELQVAIAERLDQARARLRIAASKSARPSVPPCAGSTARSGCGIIPRTLLFSDRIPAISATDPFGLSV